MLALGTWLGIGKAATLVLAVTICGVVWLVSVMIKQGFAREVPMMFVHGIFMTRYEFSRKIGRGLRAGDPSWKGPPRGARSAERRLGAGGATETSGAHAPAILFGTLATWWWTVR
jgi:hypothetical protein